MAHSNVPVYLGYDDEIIAEKHREIVNFTTNKIGGKPDWPSNTKIENPICGLCQLPRPLILQIYAPLDNNSYHRTLYIFACINPNCWNQNDSWACVRVQTLEQIHPLTEYTTISSKSNLSATDWCQDADDWDDENNANLNEENGNLINNVEKVSDEDDESYSFDESVRVGFGNLTVDDRNANTGVGSEAQGGAVGRLHSPAATAEIEGDESEVVSIDTPTIPQHDIIALLQEAAPLPQELCQKAKSDLKRSSLLQFIPYFINVGEDSRNVLNISDQHVRELLQEYQQNSDDGMNLMSPEIPSGDGGGAVGDDTVKEKYEKGIPAHGDKMFHHFLSKIQSNPGQILRYSRESTNPLLLYPLQDVPTKCGHCQGEMVFELQILPTLIPKVQLMSDPKVVSRIEFGNVLVFTCKRSCWSTDSNVRYEAVIVQTEVY